ncbi:MAG: hypothetical protein GXY18_15065 [Methanomicrobiales archaeon]|nr:hypothetical protein [Methanomicrobiales archaeon]
MTLHQALNQVNQISLPERLENVSGHVEKNFSPPKDGQNEEYSQNNKNNNNLENDWRKIPGAECTHNPLCTPLSPPGGFLQSGEKRDTKAILDPVRELEKKCGGEKFSPVFSDQQVFPPVTPDTHLMIDPDDYGPINGVWGGPCSVCGEKWVHYTEKFSQKMKSETGFRIRSVRNAMTGRWKERVRRSSPFPVS